MKIGIDKLSFYIPNYFLDLKLLAKKNGLNENKYNESLGLNKMSIVPPNEDIVTLGANAAYNIMNNQDCESIDLIIFCTESSYDQSKASSIYIHELLKLKPACRSIEIKQACYGSTAGLRIAINHIAMNPNSRVLVIASDIAKYGLRSQGEPTQGAGAVAMVISKDPKIIAFDNYTGFITKDIMDFWSPNYLNQAIVDGKISIRNYLSTLIDAWSIYKKNSKRTLKDHDMFCFHLPYTKIAESAFKKLCVFENENVDYGRVEEGLTYNKEVGNTYTASLYISLISLLDNCKKNLENKRIGFFSYGSGSVAELFSGTISKDYKNNLLSDFHFNMLKNRQELEINTYENYYSFSETYYPKDASKVVLNQETFTAKFVLSEINEHKRVYKQNSKFINLINKEKKLEVNLN